jgi:flagellar assembly protein FliH
VSINPQELLPVIREALGVFIEDNRLTRIKLNPLDLDVLAPAVRDEFKHLALMLEADPLISRGGCVMESSVRVVDGQIEKRWLRVVGQLGLQIPWKLNHVSE